MDNTLHILCLGGQDLGSTSLYASLTRDDRGVAAVVAAQERDAMNTITRLVLVTGP